MKTYLLTLSTLCAVILVSYPPVRLNAALPVRHALEAGSESPAVALEAPRAPASANSRNWAGYVARGANTREVEAAWSIARVASSEAKAAHATWIGIGGMDARDLIQVGTRAISEGGRVSYEAWYELLPAPATTIALPIAPGNTVAAKIEERAPGEWELTLANKSTGASFSTTLAYASSETSAEWIEEMPRDTKGLLPLAQFSPVSFTNAHATQNGASAPLSALLPTRLTLVDATFAPLAETSALGALGAFSVTRQ